VSLQQQTGTQFALVPYRGSATAIPDLLAGQIDLFFDGPIQLSLMRSGSIQAYAVSGETRLAQAPDIPTFGEMGLAALSHSGWYGLFAPKGTSRDIISKLNAAVVAALADPAVRSRLGELHSRWAKLGRFWASDNRFDGVPWPLRGNEEPAGPTDGALWPAAGTAPDRGHQVSASRTSSDSVRVNLPNFRPATAPLRPCSGHTRMACCIQIRKRGCR
jgi:Tripartite tricarboxylate transporter family receptor